MSAIEMNFHNNIYIYIERGGGRESQSWLTCCYCLHLELRFVLVSSNKLGALKGPKEKGHPLQKVRNPRYQENCTVAPAGTQGNKHAISSFELHLGLEFWTLIKALHVSIKCLASSLQPPLPS